MTTIGPEVDVDIDLANDNDIEDAVSSARWGDENSALFPGDTGTLTLWQRNVLLALMKKRYISADTHPQEWAALMADRRLYTSRLNDMFLELHINDAERVAFKRQAQPESGPSFPTLLLNVAYSYDETALLVFLRQRDRAARASGDSDTYVDTATMLAHLENYAPPGHTDMAGWRRRSDAAIVSLRRAKVLLPTPDEERFKIAPVLAALLPLPVLQELQHQLETRLAGAPADESSDAGADAGDEPE